MPTGICPNCGEIKNVNFCSNCGTKLLESQKEILALIQSIAEKTIKETRECSASNHDGREITKNNDCSNCLWIKANAFNDIAKFFE